MMCSGRDPPQRVTFDPGRVLKAGDAADAEAVFAAQFRPGEPAPLGGGLALDLLARCQRIVLDDEGPEMVQDGSIPVRMGKPL